MHSLYYLNLKFQASSHLMWLYSPVCVGPGRKPRRPVFSERGSNEGSGKRNPVVGVFSNILFYKKHRLHSSSQVDRPTRLFQINTLVLQSIDSRCLKTMTSYLKSTVALVSPTFDYKFRNISMYFTEAVRDLCKWWTTDRPQRMAKLYAHLVSAS